MNGTLAVLAALAGLACFIRPRGLLVARRTRQRWRSGMWLAEPQRSRWRRKRRGHSGRVRKTMRRRVLAADGQRCVACRRTAGQSGYPLQVDHGIPWIMGGLTWYPNLFTLCKPCNGTKGIYWVARDGWTYYHATWGRSDLAAARAIRAAEVRARRSPLRLARSG